MSNSERNNILANHKFLIQSKIIKDQNFQQILKFSHDQKLAEVIIKIFYFFKQL